MKAHPRIRRIAAAAVLPIAINCFSANQVSVDLFFFQLLLSLYLALTDNWAGRLPKYTTLGRLATILECQGIHEWLCGRANCYLCVLLVP